MKKVQVFDPALCCSSGVCGTDVDQALVTFSADVDWARQNGLQIERFNLAQQPMAFADNAAVKGLLERSGEAALPITLVDGEVAFVDILRGLAGLGPERDSHNLVVLRFPGDIPDNLLIQYGEMIVSYGFRNVVIQKLPFSGEKLDIIARELVKAQWSSLISHSSKGNFSNRELGVLKEYAGIE